MGSGPRVREERVATVFTVLRAQLWQLSLKSAEAAARSDPPRPLPRPQDLTLLLGAAEGT